MARIFSRTNAVNVLLANGAVGNLDEYQILMQRKKTIQAEIGKGNDDYKGYVRMTESSRQTHKDMKYCDYPDCTSGSHESDLRACSYCYAVYYCSVDHQRLQWPHHKAMCRVISKCYKATAAYGKKNMKR